MADEKKVEKYLRTPIVRLSYPALHTPHVAQQEPGEAPRAPQYGATLIFDAVSRGTTDHEKAVYQERTSALVKAIGTEAMNTFSKEFVAAGAPWFHNQSWKSPWLDGNLPKYATKGGLGPDTLFIRPSSNRIIPCVDRNGAPITDASRLYPGCYVYAALAVFSYTNPKNHGVSFGLRGIQFVKDGERLDDALDVSEYFPALEGDELGETQEEALAKMFKV